MEQSDQLPGTGQIEAERPAGHTDSDDGVWAAFAGAKTSGEFCNAWLALQCEAISAATAGLLLLQRDDTTYAPAATWPDTKKDLSYLKKAAQTALTERRGVVQAATTESQHEEVAIARMHVAYPIDVKGRLYGVVVLDVLSHSGVDLQAILRQLHWGTGWLEGLFWRVQSDDEKRKVARSEVALELVAVAEEHPQFDAAAMAVANDLALRLACDRVTVGFRVHKRVRLKAMSHSAYFQSKSQLVTGLENAMEEAFDQNVSICYPPNQSTLRRVAVAHMDFSKAWQVGTIASVVIKNKGHPVGVITLERQAGHPFDPEIILQAEAAAALVGPILGLKLRSNDWIAGQLRDRTVELFRGIFGPRHPAMKLAGIVVAAAAIFVTAAKSEFRVSAKAVLEGAVQRAAVAPFDGYIETAPMRAGDIVRQGDVLATLINRDLLLEKTRWQAERSKAQQKQRDALAKHDRANIQILAQEIAQAGSELNLVNEKLARTRITAPINGIVVTGDLSQMLGAPVTQGKVLFEIAPLDEYRVVLQVDERDIGYVLNAQTGMLSLTGSASENLSFKVNKVWPAPGLDDTCLN
jgi:hypothetical protein